MSNLLRIATTGLLTAQKSLDTISNNISNASVPEYNRQQTTQITLPSLQIGKFYYGSGVDIQGAKRVVDQFVVESMRSQNTSLGQSESVNGVLTQIDNMFADQSIGITEALNNFFDALQTLNNDPSSLPSRSIFVAQADILAQRFNEVYSQIYNFYGTINSEIGEAVTIINQYASQLTQINLKLQTLGEAALGGVPNDLLDKRDKIIFDIANYVGISVNERPDNTVDVFMGNGQTLVLGSVATKLQTAPSDTDPNNVDIVITNGDALIPISSFFNSGKIAGLMDVRDNSLGQVLNTLGRIAISISATFNQIHEQGMDLYGDLGGLMFNDFNEYNEKLSRVQQNVNNTGNAIFGVSINPIDIGNTQPDIFTSEMSLQDVGTLVPLTSNLLSINGANIRATMASDDTFSTTDNLGSALAITNAINSLISAHGVKAKASSTVYNLGQFTAGGLVAGNLTINGVQLISSGADSSTVIQDINNMQFQTGVVAEQDSAGNIFLVARDGRNIQLQKTLNSTGANFSNLIIDSGANFNKVQRASIRLTGSLGQTLTVAGVGPANVGFTPGTYPNQYGALSTDDYQLAYDGTQYSLTRLRDLTLVAVSATPSFVLDGFTLELELGAAAAGDFFTIRPTHNAAKKLEFQITDPARIAFANPVKVESSTSNRGTGNVTVTEITNITGSPATTPYVLGNSFSTQNQLTPPIRIQFTSNNSYIVLDMSEGVPGKQIGPEQSYDSSKSSNPVFPIAEVLDNTPPGPNKNYIFDPGYRLNISGVIQTGDVFDIEYNTNPSGDNRNGLALASLQYLKVMQNKSATFQDSYTQFIGSIASQASQAQISVQAGTSIMNSIETRRSEISGVNIDEEAANLLRFQQTYQANAQVVYIAKTIFDSLLHAVGT